MGPLSVPCVAIALLGNKVGFRNCTVFRNWSSETMSLYSETISLYSETLVFRNYFVVFRNYFVVFRSYVRPIQKLCSSYSETLFVVVRNYFRRIQKLFSSYSETMFVVFRNYCSSCSETFIPKLGGEVNNQLCCQLMRSFAFRVGWGGGAGAVSFRRCLRRPMLSWVRVGGGGRSGGVGLGQ